MNIFKNYDGKNHNYGRIVDGVLELAPAALIINNSQYIGNDSTKYANAGYLPIIYAEKPEEVNTGYYEATYTETDGSIVQAWNFISYDVAPGMLNTALVENWYGFFRQGLNKETAPFINSSGGKLFDYMLEGFVNSNDEARTAEKLNEILARLNFNKGQSFVYFLANNSGLTEITTPFNMPWAYILDNAFRNCSDLLNAPVVSAPICYSFEQMYRDCTAMISGGTMDVSSVDSSVNRSNALTYMYAYCSSMTDLKLIVNNLPSNAMTRTFYYTSALKNLTIEGTIKVNSNDLNVAYSPNLTVDSLVSVLNALEDNTGEETQYIVYLGSSNLAKLTEEQKQIAYSKNITLG